MTLGKHNSSYSKQYWGVLGPEQAHGILREEEIELCLVFCAVQEPELSIKIKSVPRSKHIPSQLHKPVS